MKTETETLKISVTWEITLIRTVHISVLLTANIVSHNPAHSSSDNIPS